MGRFTPIWRIKAASWRRWQISDRMYTATSTGPQMHVFKHHIAAPGLNSKSALLSGPAIADALSPEAAVCLLPWCR